MLWHIYLTRYCNLKCTYCGNDPRFEEIPSEPQYSVDKLIDFLNHDDEPIINFYGGEPLLRIKQMLAIIDATSEFIPTIKFVLQTNGILLDKIPPTCIHKFHSILVSIDGRQNVTNAYRGSNVFEKVSKNVSYIRNDLQYQGELIARMTVSRHSEIFTEVMSLLDPSINPGFTHVHWQLDALWNSETWEDLPAWLHTVYNPGIEKLINWWFDQIEDYGVIHKIIPFLGIITSLLTSKPSEIRCGSGVSSFTISTDGSLIFCPICPEEPEAVVGSIENPNQIKYVKVQEPCTSCYVLDICGGRCLYTNYFRYSNGADYDAVCQSTIFLIENLKKTIPKIKELILKGHIKFIDIEYPEINNGAEIIP